MDHMKKEEQHTAGYIEAEKQPVHIINIERTSSMHTIYNVSCAEDIRIDINTSRWLVGV